MKRIMIVLICVLCVACSSSPESKKEERKKIDGAITSPLKDLNLVREKIPSILRDAQKNPYGLDELQSSCEQLVLDIAILDQLLGADIDQRSDKKITNAERGAKALGDASINAIKRTAESVVPFRSWVRQLTGAERASKEVNDAINAGKFRRAYLKGFSAAQRCLSAEDAEKLLPSLQPSPPAPLPKGEGS